MNKRCGNCGKYPFCNKTNGTVGCCNDWIKRKINWKYHLFMLGGAKDGDTR